MRRLMALCSAVIVMLFSITFAGHGLAYPNIVTGWWAREFFRFTDYLAEKSTGPRLFVVSGSNGWVGFDGHLLEKQTGRAVINFAMHAGIDLNIYIDRLEKHLRAGDLVVLPLEHAFYRRAVRTDYEQIQQLAWMQREFALKAPLAAFEYNLSIPSEIYLKMIFARLLNGTKKLRSIEIEDILADRAAFEANGGNRDKVGHGATRLDEHGFVYTKSVPVAAQLETFHTKGGPYPVWKWSAFPDFAKAGFQRLKTLAEKRGAKLFITWPVEMLNMRNRADDEANIAPRRAFAQAFKSTGLSINCEPSDFILPYGMFHDSNYHVNALGATARTGALIRCLADAKLAQPMPQDVRTRTETLEDLERLTELRIDRSASLFGYEVAAIDLLQLKRELDVRRSEGKLASQNSWTNVPIEPRQLTTAAVANGDRNFAGSLGRSLTMPRGYRIRMKVDGAHYIAVAEGFGDCKALETIVPQNIVRSGDNCALAIWSNPSRKCAAVSEGASPCLADLSP